MPTLTPGGAYVHIGKADGLPDHVLTLIKGESVMFDEEVHEWYKTALQNRGSHNYFRCWDNIDDKEAKVAYILEKAATFGFCYIQLALSVPCLAILPTDKVKAIIDALCLIGTGVSIKDAVKTMAHLQSTLTRGCVLKTSSGGDGETVESWHDSGLEDIKLAPTRYTISFPQSVYMIHVELKTTDWCRCKTPECSHGQNICAVILLAGVEGSTIGGDRGGLTLDVSDFMEDFASAVTTQVPQPLNAGWKVYNNPPRSNTFPLTTSSAEMRVPQPPYDPSFEGRKSKVEDAYAKLEAINQEIRDSQDRLSGLHMKEELSQEPKRQEEPTVYPDDSASCVNHNNKQAAGQRRPSDFVVPPNVSVVSSATVRPLVVQPHKGTRQVQGNSWNTTTEYNSVVVPDVVVGYLQTPEQQSLDRRTRSQVRPITGLTAPFRNPRLNILIHLDTALRAVLRDVSYEDASGILMAIASSKNKSPSVFLLKEVFQMTFCRDTVTVKSNPFDLPYIEVGMSITEDLILKCIDLLSAECRTKWFTEMKSLRVPSYHDDFNWASDSSLRSRGEGRKSRPSRKSSESEVSTSRMSSVFSGKSRVK